MQTLETQNEVPSETPLEKQRETPAETLKRIYSKDQFKPVVVLLYTVLAATLWKCFSLYDLLNHNYIAQMRLELMTQSLTQNGVTQNFFTFAFIAGTYKIVSAFILFAVIPMCIVKFVFREKLADYGLRKGILLYAFRSSLIMLPVVSAAAFLAGKNPAFSLVYPLNRDVALISPYYNDMFTLDYKAVFFAVHCILYTGYYFGWEFLFRGFLQHGLSERCGIATAVLVQTLASVMLHYGHPPLEVFGAVLAGLFWGFLAVRTRSLYAGMIQHAWLGIVLDTVIVFRL